jgi:hypothetical protein
MTHAHEILERWNFGPGAPPLPGRVAPRLGELVHRFREALKEENLDALRVAVEDLESLKTALEMWTQVELDHATLHEEPKIEK